MSKGECQKEKRLIATKRVNEKSTKAYTAIAISDEYASHAYGDGVPRCPGPAPTPAKFPRACTSTYALPPPPKLGPGLGLATARIASPDTRPLASNALARIVPRDTSDGPA